MLLRSDELSVSINTRGAELSSIRRGETEYLWQADPAVWNRHAPVLFPIVGALKNGTFRWEGREYRLPRHGFARDMEFTPVEKQEHFALLELRDTQQTKANYPFAFCLRIGYALRGSTIDVEYHIGNPGGGVLPFSIGAHPAFNLPLGGAGSIGDHVLIFDQPQTAALTPRSTHGGTLVRTTRPFLANAERIPVTPDMFDCGALVFRSLQSRNISLASTASSHRIRVSFDDFPVLGLWGNPGAGFICIEPWAGHADFEDADGDLKHKAGIMALEPGGEHRLRHRISIEPR